jgi:hypothetical protein
MPMKIGRGDMKIGREIFSVISVLRVRDAALRWPVKRPGL